jgi:hypothetical protein
MRLATWELGWDALVALGTLALAFVTAALAWTTRRLARATGQEVRALSRPLLLPAHDAEVQVAVAQKSYGPLNVLRIPMRNAGNGPALRVAIAVDAAGLGPWQATVHIPAIAAGDEIDAEVPVFLPSGQTELPNLLSAYIECRDLGGLQYATQLSLNLTAEENQSSVSGLVLVEGSGFFKPILPSLKPMPTRYRRKPLRPRLRAAARELFLEPGDAIKPLRPRIKAAWHALRPRRRQSIVQRIRWARWADRINLQNDAYPTPSSLGRIRRRLHVIRMRAQRMRWAYHEFR